jgi:predicted alpha/beta-fold hydrolase
MTYRAPCWLPGGHAQTLYPLFIRPRPPHYRRERWTTPDGDFIDLDWVDGPAGTPEPPLLVLFHGLEGSSRSHYAAAVMGAVRAHRWAGVVPHFRGCSGELNLAPRAYHSGDSTEIDWILRRLRQQFPQRKIFAAGISLGGNALLKWLGEQEAAAAGVIDAAAAICPPLDLAACGHRLARGVHRLYTHHFLRTLKASSRARLERHPGLFDRRRMERARTLYDFDDAVTAPLHGYRDADDYWTRASSKPWLPHVRVPTLLVSPVNDPFLPAAALPRAERGELSPAIRFEMPATGGHVGFVGGTLPGHLHWLPHRLLTYFSQEL